MLNVVVLVSGGGTNLQALIDATKDGRIKNARLVKVISSNADAYALKRAKKHDIDTAVVSRKDYPDTESYNRALLSEINTASPNLIVLAGFLSILGEDIIKAYPYKIINVHPSLIPSFCGKGYYGLKVHEEALRCGVRITGATVHFVNEVCDGGAIIAQKSVEVFEDDTPETLQKRVMEQAEWELLPMAVNLICNDRVEIKEGKVRIRR